MRLYRKVIPKIAKDIISTLCNEAHIEVSEHLLREAELDMESIMKSYLDRDDQIFEEAKDSLARRGLPYERLQSVRKAVAEERQHKLGEEGIDWVIEQMLEFMMISKNVDEVYSDDPTLRRKIYLIIKKHLEIEEELDREVREKLKHLKEGTPQWDIEYSKEMERLKKLKGLI